eukprot:evm.model.scf_1105.2 EVM.evm.TU.scf_1105.2   scf_1105:11459-16932(+)
MGGSTLRSTVFGPRMVSGRPVAAWRELRTLFCRHLVAQAKGAATPCPAVSLYPPSCCASSHGYSALSPFQNANRLPFARRLGRPLSDNLMHGRRRGSGLCAAKKSKKGGAKKKGGSKLNAKAKEPWKSTDSIMLLLLLVESYKRVVGEALMEDADISNIADDIWNAPFAILTHDRFVNDPVRFTYANKAALALFEAEWDELVGMVSTKAAAEEEVTQKQRNDLLQEAEEKGFVRGTDAPRVSLKGTKFSLQDFTLFNIESPAGKKMGQAVVFDKWVYEDGTVGGAGVTAPHAVPSDEELAVAEARVAELAAAVRSLKEGKGLTNKDEEVQTAVASLLESKEKLAHLQRLKEGAPEMAVATPEQ